MHLLGRLLGMQSSRLRPRALPQNVHEMLRRYVCALKFKDICRAPPCSLSPPPDLLHRRALQDADTSSCFLRGHRGAGMVSALLPRPARSVPGPGWS